MWIEGGGVSLVTSDGEMKEPRWFDSAAARHK